MIVSQMPPDEQGQSPPQDLSGPTDLEQQRRRLETLGRLSGNFVHDFNNLLMVIEGYTRMLLEEPNLSAAASENAQEILRASERASALTKQLLAFSRKKTSEAKPIELNSQLRHMRQMLMRLLGETVRLEFELSPQPCTILANLSQVEQVLLNLIVNARDAMPVGGKILVRTRITPTEVLLEVEDNGTGIPEELLPRIFEPFFTTKEEGKGTGIGLALVDETVREWGGRIAVSTEVKAGTRFEIQIPRWMQPETQPAAIEVSHRATILIVEDEDGVRSLIRRVLEQRNYRVLDSASEENALELARSEKQLDLLITDIEIQGGQGTNVASLVRLIHPGIRIIFISGHLQELPGMNEIALQKPFSPNTLVLAVQDLLQSS